MKKIALLILGIVVLAACKKEHPKEYLSFKGNLKNNTDSILTISGFAINKVIAIDKDGNFSDSMKVATPNLYSLRTNSGKRGFIYLANGFDLNLQGDAEDFMNSFTYSGEGSESNNLSIAQLQYSKSIGNPMEFFALDKPEFDAKIASIKKGMDSLMNKYKGAKKELIEKTASQNERLFNFLNDNFEKQHPIAKKRAALMAKVQNGKPSPEFKDYENYKGGTSSLSDFRGKYVYIDLWATWCKPCIGEIPYLQKLEKEFHDKNIEFISISIDNERTAKTWDNAHKKWKAMVYDKSLTGTQLYAGKDISFVQDYQVTGIPRFILIDPEGKIVNNNAPRPSNPELKRLLQKLL